MTNTKAAIVWVEEVVDNVILFFRSSFPELWKEYLTQERQNHEIDGQLSAKLRSVLRVKFPGKNSVEIGLLILRIRVKTIEDLDQ